MTGQRDAIDAAEDVIGAAVETSAAAEDIDVRLRRMGMKLSALVDRLDDLRQARDESD